METQTEEMLAQRYADMVIGMLGDIKYAYDTTDETYKEFLTMHEKIEEALLTFDILTTVKNTPAEANGMEKVLFKRTLVFKDESYAILYAKKFFDIKFEVNVYDKYDNLQDDNFATI